VEVDDRRRRARRCSEDWRRWSEALERASAWAMLRSSTREPMAMQVESRATSGMAGMFGELGGVSPGFWW
jgi:hypothetical protein